MKPRHFWWLVETLEKRSGPDMSDEDKGELLDLLERAERGEI